MTNIVLKKIAQTRVDSSILYQKFFIADIELKNGDTVIEAQVDYLVEENPITINVYIKKINNGGNSIIEYKSDILKTLKEYHLNLE
ncbi:MAG TPA: hypothetical protein PKY81_01075 [bacterium]|nr:hypothetical protein [bacterium]HPN29526.1 hypothetical protein [bacterium]